MHFTALHRLLGRAPGPVEDDLLDAAVEAGLTETDFLDWKRCLPAQKDLRQHDFVKDVAAMANSGGGTIAFGVEETQKAATEQCDAGECDENYERSLRAVAAGAISPPVLGLGVHRLGEVGRRAVVVVVPASIDGPHLIYKGDYFAAPMRNDADTIWMGERQLEAMYRARFDERRHADEALANLYDEAGAGWDIGDRAWLIAVARPRIPTVAPVRPTRDEARSLLMDAEQHTLKFCAKRVLHPLESVDRDNPKPGLRRWTAPNKSTSDDDRWREAWASIHHDGSISLAMAIGSQLKGDRYLPGELVSSARVEAAVSDLMGMIRAVGDRRGAAEYEARIGIEWSGAEPLRIEMVNDIDWGVGTSIPLAQFTPVTMTVLAGTDDVGFRRQVYELAQDCVNQGGIGEPRLILRPDE